MSLKKISKFQPDHFQFNEKNLMYMEKELKKYPKAKKASAVISLLYLAQKQNNNWIPLIAIKYIAKLLSMSYMQVYEVATFYSMFNLSPVGKYFVQVCTTTPCMIRGSKKIVEVCKKYIAPKSGEISKNQLCSWTEVECLGSCVSAPMMQINDDYYEDLDEKKAEEIITNLLDDKLPAAESARNRKNNAPENERKTLLEIKNA